LYDNKLFLRGGHFAEIALVLLDHFLDLPELEIIDGRTYLFLIQFFARPYLPFVVLFPVGTKLVGKIHQSHDSSA
jgi:hypothetical protein